MVSVSIRPTQPVSYTHLIYHEVIRRMKEMGLMEDADGYLRLTERGIDLSNYVMSEFLLSV